MSRPRDARVTGELDRTDIRLRRGLAYAAVLASTILTIWLTAMAIRYFEQKFLQGTKTLDVD